MVKYNMSTACQKKKKKEVVVKSVKVPVCLAEYCRILSTTIKVNWAC